MIRYLFVISTIFVFSNFNAFAQTDWYSRIEVEGLYYQERNIDVSVFKDGILAYTFSKKLIPHYSLPSAEVMTNGNLILFHSLEGVVEIYDQSGIKINEQNFYEYPPYREQQINYNLNENGVVIITSEKNQNKLYRISNSGNIEFKDELNPGLVLGLASSYDAAIISYSTAKWSGNDLYTKTFFIDESGNALFSISSNFETGKFDVSKSQFLGISEKNAFRVSLEDRKVNWSSQLKEKEFYMDGIIEGNDIYILKGINPSLQNGEWISDKVQIIKKPELGEESVIGERYNVSSDLKLTLKSGDAIILE